MLHTITLNAHQQHAGSAIVATWTTVADRAGDTDSAVRSLGVMIASTTPTAESSFAWHDDTPPTDYYQRQDEQEVIATTETLYERRDLHRTSLALTTDIAAGRYLWAYIKKADDTLILSAKYKIR